MAGTSWDALDADISEREAVEAEEARQHRALVDEIRGLQRALEEINAKSVATKKENADLATENAALSSYIDSLMANIVGMGSLITADKGRRVSLFGRKNKAVKVDSHVGELSAKPVQTRGRATSIERPLQLGSGPLASPAALPSPMRIQSPGTSSALSIINSAYGPAQSRPTPPPPPPPPPETNRPTPPPPPPPPPEKEPPPPPPPLDTV